MAPDLEQVQEQYRRFVDDFESVVLATVDADGKPNASYAPFVRDSQRRIWCFVSGLSRHTANLASTGRASAFFVEDESAAAQIFARRRLTYECDAEIVDRESADAKQAAAAFVDRFGTIAEQILGMPDFRPVRLTPRSGSFVIGFGAAYEIKGDALDDLVHQTGGGGGHGHGGGGGHGHGHGHAHGAHGGHAGHGHGGHGGHAHGHGAHGHGGHGGQAHGHGGHGHGAHGQAHGGEHGHDAGARSGRGAAAHAHAHDAGSHAAREATFPTEVVHRIVSHMNDDHIDALLAIARRFGDAEDATGARMTGIDAHGLSIEVEGPAGAREVRVGFPQPLASAGEAKDALIALTREARVEA